MCVLGLVVIYLKIKLTAPTNIFVPTLSTMPIILMLSNDFKVVPIIVMLVPIIVMLVAIILMLVPMILMLVAIILKGVQIILMLVPIILMFVLASHFDDNANHLNHGTRQSPPTPITQAIS